MIVVGRLVDGVEIIGNLVSETENGLQITNPLQIIYKYTTDSFIPIVSFARFMMFADQHEFDFQKVDFVVIAQAVPEMAGVYEKMVKQLISSKKNLAQSSSDENLFADVKAEFYKELLQSLDHEDMTKH